MQDQQRVVVGLGEVLWDIFPSGPRFGGAPANFACSLKGLSGDRHQVFMVSGVGQDELGTKALETLRRHRVDTTYVSQQTDVTGTVLVKLDEQGNASYTFAANTAWDNLTWQDSLGQLAAQSDAVCFGTLAQRSEHSRKTIEQFVAATSSDCLRIFDVNLRPPFYEFETIVNSLKLANVLKINEHELQTVAEHEGLVGEAPELLRALSEKYHLDTVALTMGDNGSMLLKGGQLSRAPVQETTLVDTVGAGDAFTSALALGLLADKSLDAINVHASRVAAYVCSQQGAAPEFPDELKSFYRD